MIQITITQNGKKSREKQNYRCKDCGRRFISDHERTYQGCFSWVVELV
ncbi:MAG: IS1 family transposase, partial [Spirochaetaceae bacterium]|nr:IS1 family transposase [Spirochaetaceae bacterium]